MNILHERVVVCQCGIYEVLACVKLPNSSAVLRCSSFSQNNRARSKIFSFRRWWSPWTQ